MTDKKLTLYAWENNAAAVVWAVQGENKSRTLELTIIETRGGEGSQWGAEVIDKPLDLTGMSVPRLYVSKPDNTSVFVDGVIVDAKKGIVSFDLTAQQLAVPGTASCQIVLTKPSGEVLKVIGMQLDIQRSGLDDALESDDDFVAVVLVLERATKAAERAEAAAQTAEGVAKEVKTAYDAGQFIGPQGPPGSVGLGNCNIVVDSNRRISSTAYVMGTFAVTSLTAGARYTIVACFDAPPGQSLLVAASNGSTMANLSTPTTGNIYVTRGARAPSSSVAPELRVYNYPQGATSAITLHWMCVYSGDLSDPPLYWTPSTREILNQYSGVKMQNLISNSHFATLDGWLLRGSLAYLDKGAGVDGGNCLHTKLEQDSGFYRSVMTDADKTYTFSVWVKVLSYPSGASVVLGVGGTAGRAIQDLSSLPLDTWQRVNITFMGWGSTQNLYLLSRNCEILIDRVKLEVCAYATDWCPALSDTINSNVQVSGITMADGKTLEDVLQEGGLLPVANKGTWEPTILLTGDNTAEFQRSSYAVSGSNVMVKTYMRFTQKMTGQTVPLTINGLPFVSTVKTKGGQVQGWAKKTEPKELYPIVNANSSALSITAAVGAVDMPVQASQLDDGQAWAYISITYPIK